ncbi:MAG: hypothetical protein A2161_22575 [Candidatus Schekmanbacteria bacterium RBG_13_48_7]|uniref:Uncharacterized protein n=1 Tax=Candidatus Schekmanbacteria bacterium RBG_13_48_7 TaxID=1817878 RepID=A0A1F7RS98_9BACT|nr:MAG: hypothetical protein A2161_22575 [Candidatus Schekmanbacteria bacterium RBG_13_48_7]
MLFVLPELLFIGFFFLETLKLQQILTDYLLFKQVYLEYTFFGKFEKDFYEFASGWKKQSFIY